MIGRQIRLRVSIGLVALTLLVTSQVARAEYLGLLHGRMADVSRMPTLSTDVGIVLGDDYQLLGVRANYKLTPIFLVYGNLGFGEIGRTDGVPFGLGALYTVENLFSGLDVGVKASYQTGKFEFKRFNISATTSVFALEMVGSTQSGFGPQSNIDLYGNIGFHYFNSDFLIDDLEFSFGGGAIMPVGPGEVFVGIDFIDDAMFGGGFRLFF